MKTILISSITISLFFLASVLPAMSQSAERTITPLNENDFTCFQNLECACSNKDLAAKGWVFTFDETVNGISQDVTAVMKGRNISLTAQYDKNGNLTSAVYKVENIALPPQLLIHLVDDQYSGFTMIANEKMVKDFDPNKTVYSVTMQNGESVKKLTFDKTDFPNEVANTFAEN